MTNRQGFGCAEPHEPGVRGAVQGTFLPVERGIVHRLISHGHNVARLSSTSEGRTPDALVCGAPVEFKALASPQARVDIPYAAPVATANTVTGALMRAAQQSRAVVLDVRRSDISMRELIHGIVRHFDPLVDLIEQHGSVIDSSPGAPHPLVQLRRIEPDPLPLPTYVLHLTVFTDRRTLIFGADDLRSLMHGHAERCLRTADAIFSGEVLARARAEQAELAQRFACNDRGPVGLPPLTIERSA